MSWMTRITNALGGGRLDREIDEELQSHLREAVEQGRDPAEARRAFGSVLRQRESARDAHVAPWLDSLRADAVFALRQLRKRKTASAAAILSLGLAIGACTTAFRLIDALMLRPLPIAAPERLYAVAKSGVDADGRARTANIWAYPAFVLMRAAVKDEAELVAASYASQMDVTYGGDAEIEKATVQYVSGWMFREFGLHPAAGRLLTEDDDRHPGAHPYAVLSNRYWQSRFGGDPRAVGRTFHMGDIVYEIVGVAPAPFSGTERGTFTDIFVPTMMHPAVTKSDWTWFRMLAVMKPGAPIEPTRARLHATSRAFEEERAKGFTGMSQESIRRFLDLTVRLDPAPAGASDLQQEYGQALLALAVVVGLVLLIACLNVANLMTAQAAARAREIALRVSIGAGRGRIVQLMTVESLCLALAAAAVGALFAQWAAPFVLARINPPGDPAQLDLPMDWRVVLFGLVLTLCVTALLGLVPALRASSVRPASALKGGENPHVRQRLMHALIAAQVAFCFVVVFVAGLFATTFDRLAHRPMGFNAERLLAVDAVSARPQSPVYWEQVADQLRRVPGVERVALAGFPLLAGRSWNGFVSVNGAPPGPMMAYFVNVSPGWVDTMGIPFVAGHDLPPGDASVGQAIVNEAFVRTFCAGIDPLTAHFGKGTSAYRVAGVVRDAPYESLRDTVPPVVYVSIRVKNGNELDALGQSHIHGAHLHGRSHGAGRRAAPRSAARAQRIPGHQYPIAEPDRAGTDRARAPSGDAGGLLRRRRATARGHRTLRRARLRRAAATP